MTFGQPQEVENKKYIDKNMNYGSDSYKFDFGQSQTDNRDDPYKINDSGSDVWQKNNYKSIPVDQNYDFKSPVQDARF